MIPPPMTDEPSLLELSSKVERVVGVEELSWSGVSDQLTANE